VFVHKPTCDRALARLRIFTTQQELPLAGHPVIGTWFLLAELGVVPAREGTVHVWQQTGAGVLPVEIEFEDGRPLCVTMTQRAARFQRARIAKPALTAALGLKASDLDSALPIEAVSTGVYNLMIPLRRREALKRIRVSPHELLKAMGGEGTVAYCFALGQRGEAFARGMLPWAVQEDPATGSAAGSLAAYLVHHGRLEARKPLQIVQGVEMGRPSQIYAFVLPLEQGKLVPLVRGCAVRILEATIEA